MIVPIDGLFETHLTVANLDASVLFYRDVLGLELGFRLDERRVVFFWLGERGRSMLGVWETGSAPNTLHLHTAFRCALVDLLTAPDRLRAGGVTP
jgi:lactoylglutathione lyase